MEYTFTAQMPLPDYVELDDTEVSCYVISETEDGVELDNNVPIDIRKLFSQEVEQDVSSVTKALREKAFEKSAQTRKEIGFGKVHSSQFEDSIQPLPYDPDCFANFLEISEVHASCVDTKVEGAVGRKYLIKPQYPVQNAEDEVQGEEFTITPEEYKKDFQKIQNFIKNCNEELSFEEVLKLVAKDRQSIGWGAFEVIREASGKIARLQRVPAVRLRVLEGFSGYVEVTGIDEDKNTVYTYYQRFGDKVVVDVPDPFSEDKEKKIARPYSPEEDGDLKIGENGIRWNLVSRKDGKVIKGGGLEAFKESANEILYLPNNHNNTVYYGYADVVPAISAILGNVYIRDYVHQFFEHNCVPRWAIIVKGAKVDGKFRELLEKYFKENIRGKNNQTLLLTLGGNLQNATVEFKKLDVDHKEADFMATTTMHNQQIMTAERVPAVMIGISDRNTASGRGLGAAEIFKDYVITPLQQYYARKLNRLFRLGLGVTNAKLEFMELDVRDSLTKAHINQILNNMGAFNINEVRDEYGAAAISGGDIHFVRIKDGSAVKVEDLGSLLYRGESENQDSETVGLGENLENNLNNAFIANQISEN